MRAVIQRVTRASVTSGGSMAGSIQNGLLVLLGVGEGDTPEDAKYIASKSVNLRIFEDDDGKLNRSVLDTGGSVLLVSQFTLYGDARHGRRPSFSQAAQPGLADSLYELVATCMRQFGIKVETGVFRTEMQVELVNDGPVTILLDSGKEF